jgi:predicted ATP-grasp superfamily ATP-dependent carboligase
LAQHFPVVLLGGLNLLRPLGRAGIPVIVATPDARAPVLASRFCSGSLLLPPLGQRAGVALALVRLGERLLRELGKPVPLFYGNDDVQTLIQEHREALAPYFRLVLNEPATARALLDKDLFQTLAENRGLPVPRVLRWDELARVECPVLVKPKTKTAWDESAVHLRLFEGAGKARVFASGRDVVGNPLVELLREQLLFQEYLPGDDRNLYSFHGFATERSEVLAWFVGRKVRTWPALTGATSYLELAHEDDVALAGLDAVARLGLKGVFKVDFKKDARTGRYRLLEVNARFNLWHHAAAWNGLNLPLIAYEYLVHGRRPAWQDYDTKVRWLCFELDFRAYRDLTTQGQLGAAAWLRSLADAPKVYDVFSWSDPVPFLHHLAGRVKSIPRISQRLLRWLVTAY